MRAILVAIIVALVLAGLLRFLFAPIPLMRDAVSTAYVRWELPRAEKRWRTSGIEAYRLHVKGTVPHDCIVDGELEVRGVGMTGVLMQENTPGAGSPLMPADQRHWDEAICSFDELGVEQTFERVERDLDRLGLLGAPLSVGFDEETGYVTEYRVGEPSQGRLFGDSASECCTWLTFDSLITLPSG